MSVNVADKAELMTLAHSLVVYGLMYKGKAHDLMAGISAAQVMAYTLSYGESGGPVPLSNRETVTWGGEILEPTVALRKLSMLQYNTVSNSGTHCLPNPYLEQLEALKIQLAEYDRARVGGPFNTPLEQAFALRIETRT